MHRQNRFIAPAKDGRGSHFPERTPPVIFADLHQHLDIDNETTLGFGTSNFEPALAHAIEYYRETLDDVVIILCGYVVAIVRRDSNAEAPEVTRFPVLMRF